MITEAIYRLVNREDLPYDDTAAVMDEIMSGTATSAQMAAFLTAIRAKGESIDEIAACASVMRRHSRKLLCEGDVLDIVGTGGDEAHTFNISTISALVISAAGVPVAKHGNRSVSSRCGSADVLEALGVRLDLGPEQSARILKEIGICFLFAPAYHTAMRHVAPVRRELGIRTIFNILGPLTNPAGANLMLLGVYAEELVEPMARVLAKLGVRRAMVVHGHDGLDEITLCGATTVCEVSEGRLNSFFLEPGQLGFSLCAPGDLTGGEPAENAEIALEVLGGKPGPKRDAVLLNSAVCLYMAKNQMTLRQCAALAAEQIDSGRALEQLRRFAALSREA